MITALRGALTALIAAIEAAAIALASFAAIAVPLLLVWWLAFDLAAEPSDMIAAAAGGWLLAHLVPLAFTIGPEAALAFGLDPEALAFTVSLAPLGLTLLTVVLAARAGWRLADRGGLGATGLLGGAVGFGLMAWLAALLGAELRAWPILLAILVPTLCYTVSASVAFVLRAAIHGDDWWFELGKRARRGLHRLHQGTNWGAVLDTLPERAAQTLRLAAASVLGLVALGAVGLAAAIVVGYVDVVTLSQSLQPDALGLIALFLLGLAVLPVGCIWAVSWFIGSGFAIGAGSSVTPFETLLGPLPAFPLLGAIPQHGWGWAGALAPALVVLLAVGVGALGKGRQGSRRGTLLGGIAVVVVAAALVGCAVAALTALASGSVGPQRLSIVGVRPWAAGAYAAVEIGVGLLLGVLARRFDLGWLRAASPVGESERAPDPDPDPHPNPEPAPATIHEAAPTRTPPIRTPATPASSPAPEDEDALVRSFWWDAVPAGDQEAAAASDAAQEPDPARKKRPGWRSWRRER